MTAPLRPPRVRRSLRVAGWVAVLLLAAPSSAGAHAVLLTSSPGWNAVLAAAPRAVTLRYDEDVVPGYARVAVVTPGGRDLAGPARVTGSVVVVPLEAGRAGARTSARKVNAPPASTTPRN